MAENFADQHLALYHFYQLLESPGHYNFTSIFFTLSIAESP